MNRADFHDFDHQAVLNWYDERGRDFPWRRRWPELAPAYHVFLSEFMLQQTGVKTVIPYFLHFTQKWPDIFALAAADIDEVLADWAGLGYYARARNMHKTAKVIASEYHGEFPEDEKALRALPGIGPYTAGAILRFAFDQPAIVLDGNIERVLVRFGDIHKPVAEIKPLLREAFATISPAHRHADFPQALMDLASTVCQPKSAHCSLCPLEKGCRAAQTPHPEELPLKARPKTQPLRYGRAYLITSAAGHFVMHRRDANGLLGGMLGFPSAGWDKTSQLDEAFEPVVEQAVVIGTISHVFTHFKTEVTIYHLHLEQPDTLPLPPSYHWAEDKPSDWPKLMQKCRSVLKS